MKMKKVKIDFTSVESKLDFAYEILGMYKHSDFTVIDYSVRDDEDEKYKIINFIGSSNFSFSISNALWNDLNIEVEETIDILIDATEDLIENYTTIIKS